MREIEKLPPNGYKLVSTFSGCGGSCLGFRMAGFQTLWASEFIAAARDVYRLNHPGIAVDERDIRKVHPSEILDVIGLRPGELDVLEGSPPCASFSTAGKREAHWGEVKKYSDTKQRTDDLFFEFARILRGLQPRMFVAENVSGLVKGKAKGYFKEILAELKDCGYVVKAKLLDAQWLGVPQARQRIIFVGVRNDLGVQPVHPAPLPFRYSVRDAIPWIIQHGTSPHFKRWEAMGRDPTKTLIDSSENPCPTIVQSGQFSGVGYCVARAVHDTSGQWSQGDITDRPCPAVTVGNGGMNSIHYRIEGDELKTDPDTDEKISIEGTAIGNEWDNLKVGESSDKYFNLKRVALDGPSSTVTQMGGNLGAAAVAHPVEKRKFTIAELKRICAFPDDFELSGSYAQRWERLGRAVPPVMMWHVAREVRGLLEKLDRQEPWEYDPPYLMETMG